MSKFNKYISNDGGNVSLMFAGGLTLMLILTGAAVDFGNASRLQSQLQSQVDAGVLAAATLNISSSDSENVNELRTQAAYKVLEANGFSNGKITPTLEISEDSIILTAELEYTPFFGGFIGKDKMRLSADSESGLGAIPEMEIVLVLDNTLSMYYNSKMDALETGAKELVAAVKGSGSGTKIGLVPFARYVRIPDSMKNESWLELPTEYDTLRTWQQSSRSGGTCIDVEATNTRDGVEYSYTTIKCTGETVTYTTQSKILESRFNNCIGTRSTPYSEMDGSYTTKIPGLLNEIPYEVSGLKVDVNAYCPAEMVDLTDDYDWVTNSINNFFPTGNTHIPSGLIWGQRMLSPGMPFDNMDDGSEKRQVLILMTDGENTTEIMEDNQAVANLDAPPYIADVEDGEVANYANAMTSRLCTSIKDQGIEIYTIAFQLDDTATTSMLSNCASSLNTFYTADTNDELVAEFSAIADSLRTTVRLIR